ncbi:MAG TPA: C1 family peptidase [Chthonomonadaceae bacterium]|nr:C1 family peptidase [Chthonomonadaceae bacterium]
MAELTTASASNGLSRVHNLHPDSRDLRDRLYEPTLRVLPHGFNTHPYEAENVIIFDQGATEACAGFALAAMIEWLKVIEARVLDHTPFASTNISPFMLYYMAQRYDSLSGTIRSAGTTARAAMKAWQKNGACRLDLWPDITTTTATAGHGWLSDAFRTPLGAYYRVDHGSIPDIHAALNETGAVFATAQIHPGWYTPSEAGAIPYEFGDETIGGHAFLLVGYDEKGFWLQNSWGAGWGLGGFARISYGDWRANAMDAWIGQLGVHISSHVDSMSAGLNFTLVRNAAQQDGMLVGGAERALLSSDPNVSAQQINAYVVDITNNGILSTTGQFQTTPADLHALVTHYLPKAIADWNIGEGQVDVALYAHGGLDDQNVAEQIAKFWIPALYANKVFPIFFMWQTGLLETLRDKVQDLLGGTPEVAGASLFGNILDFWDDRIESLISVPGTIAWDEMKKNACLASNNPDGGLQMLYRELQESNLASRLRFHLIGHSAGAIFHADLLPIMLKGKLKVDGLYFMAPAARMDLFQENILPFLRDGSVPAYTEFYLQAATELADNCLPLPYHRSLLYLVSDAFEKEHPAPLLGMAKYLAMDGLIPSKPAGAQVWDFIASPTPSSVTDPAYVSQASHHGGFGEDSATQKAILTRILARRRNEQQ